MADSYFPILIRTEKNELLVIAEPEFIPQGIAFHVLETNFNEELFSMAKKIYCRGLVDGIEEHKKNCHVTRSYPPPG